MISMMTQDRVWQVVDRKLTDLSERVVSTDTNKAILFARCMLFAYTGPARLGGHNTANWIADLLASGRTGEDSIVALVEALNRSLPTIIDPRAACIVIDGVGWGVDRQQGSVGPRLVRISNCMNTKGDITTHIAPQVRVFDAMLKDHVAVNMRAAGQRVPLETGRFWERIIRRRIMGRAAPEEVGKCLVEFVRSVSARNRAVGKGVLLSSIPLAGVLRPTGMTIASMPIPEGSTFKYFPESSNEGVDKGPEIANPGGCRMSNFFAETKPDGSQVVEASFKLSSAQLGGQRLSPHCARKSS